MANAAVVDGARPVRYLNGAKWNGKTTLYAISIGTTTNAWAAVGDAVVSTGTADSEGHLIVKTRLHSGGGDVNTRIRGFIQAIVPGTPGFRVTSLAAPTTEAPEVLTTPGKGYVRVIDDPNVVFLMRASAALPITSVGLTASLLKTTGHDTRSLRPKLGLGILGSATSAFTMSIVGYPMNTHGKNVVNSTYNTVEVVINNHELARPGLGI